MLSLNFMIGELSDESSHQVTKILLRFNKTVIGNAPQ